MEVSLKICLPPGDVLTGQDSRAPTVRAGAKRDVGPRSDSSCRRKIKSFPWAVKSHAGTAACPLRWLPGSPSVSSDRGKGRTLFPFRSCGHRGKIRCKSHPEKIGIQLVAGTPIRPFLTRPDRRRPGNELPVRTLHATIIVSAHQATGSGKPRQVPDRHVDPRSPMPAICLSTSKAVCGLRQKRPARPLWRDLGLPFPAYARRGYQTETGTSAGLGQSAYKERLPDHRDLDAAASRRNL